MPGVMASRCPAETLAGPAADPQTMGQPPEGAIRLADSQRGFALGAGTTTLHRAISSLAGGGLIAIETGLVSAMSCTVGLEISPADLIIIIALAPAMPTTGATTPQINGPIGIVRRRGKLSGPGSEASALGR